MPLQWRNQRWQSLKEGDGKRCSERDLVLSGADRTPPGDEPGEALARGQKAQLGKVHRGNRSLTLFLHASLITTHRNGYPLALRCPDSSSSEAFNSFIIAVQGNVIRHCP